MHSPLRTRTAALGMALVMTLSMFLSIESLALSEPTPQALARAGQAAAADQRAVAPAASDSRS